MGWELSTWLALARSSQLLGSLAAAAMHGYLTVRVYTGDLGLSKEMVVLELLACLLLGYSTLVIILQHTGHRSKKSSWLTGFVVCDVLVCAVLLVMISTLARAGLPVHCAALFVPNSNQRSPISTFTTIGFSNENPGQRGELDHFCGLDRSYYAIANALIFTYIFTITATVLRIFEKKYTKNTKISEMLESLERAEHLNLKVIDSPSPIDESHSFNQPPPASEGIITRNASLRSNFTAATSVAASQTGPYGSNPTARRSIGHSAPAIPRRPVPPIPSSTAAAAASPGIAFVPVPLDEEDGAEAALVADGMRHPRHQQHHQQQAQHYRNPSRDQFPRMPILSEEALLQSADAALVSDGMRPSEPMLPPYHPGNRRMSGHGAGDDNEMRLSGYVKGQTRAQDMKDSGRY
ncbi:hypothetical protein C8A00DRAFT_10838 [Chaetomidium leptoderma]|uniref:Uncharacterized protein n=1 Tax=Chaetomidium leptoderma TaxID=669021 RepID=A0AAN6VV49_9PEZI|nr:hypothetical protein C8A00DRAFT_10838 [Chaetomidium leptoderma]